MDSGYDVRDALRWGGILGTWLAGAWLTIDSLVVYGRYGDIGEDAHAYWLTAHAHQLYGAAPGAKDAFLYSPAFAQAIRPLALMPFPAFAAAVIAVDVAAFAWLLAPLGWRWAGGLMLLLAPEFVLGQVLGVITVAAVLAMGGRAGWWALGWLTKVTPGLVGAVWCAGRRDWRGLAAAAAWTVGLATVSAAVWPSAWADWFRFTTSTGAGTLVALRTAAGLVLVYVGARRRWVWTVPVALVMSAPTIGAQDLAYLAALVRLRGHDFSRGSVVVCGPGPRSPAGRQQHHLTDT